uniref:S1 RNA-binding domain-containing protein 1 n=1 Tax=Callorhinchus milii TaxID=7868 RepID=A0A4W3H4U4_CALMI|eukprot:gi/632958459/ref/XP_007895051.1/ PREDICTED: S1 RNA-binding domain-containing protein 1 [Callorhinchus milii]
MTSRITRKATLSNKEPLPEEEDEVPSFLILTSDSEEEEEEWVPEVKVAKKPRKPTAPKKVTVKKRIVRSTAAKKTPVKKSTGAKKRTKSTGVDVKRGHNVKPNVAISEIEGNEEESSGKLPPGTWKPRDDFSVDFNFESSGSSTQHVGRKIKQERQSLVLIGDQEDNRIARGQQNYGNNKPEPKETKPIKKETVRSGSDISQPSTNTNLGRRKLKEEGDISFTWREPPAKKQKKTVSCPVKLQKGLMEIGNFQMNWDITQVLHERTNVELWVCANLIKLFKEENTIPFIARYRKELTNNMEADIIREVQQALEELTQVMKKTHASIQKIEKQDKLTSYLKVALLNCKTSDEVEYLFAPYKTGSNQTKAQKARQLGLEPAANLLIENPNQLNLHSHIRANIKGLSTLAEVEKGVQHILADMMSKDRDTLDFIWKLCDQNMVLIQSTLLKAATKQNAGTKRDTEKFHLYHNFSCSIRTIHHHQILAINRGEKLKILTVKVNVPDRVKNEFCWWCINKRWRPKNFASPGIMKILTDSAEDSYKRLICPLLCREFRTRLKTNAEMESILMFGRNLRQVLLTNPVRGRVLLGVDPGFRNGCKLAIVSPTSQILHTDVVYLLGSGVQREAEKIRRLLHEYSCWTVVIGNGTACRETEAFFADLINRKYFAPLDVVYCITSEAGASIYSVSPEAVKEMPDLDPNLRSAVSIARRVQDPLAEMVKIEPKHIGVGMYQHDVAQTLLKATLDSVVEECVSFVGVDINISSETLMRHVAGLNASRAKSIIEWREKNGAFINREQLKEVRGLGPKTFQQCAGFIRINPENIKGFCSSQPSTSAAGGQGAGGKGSGSKAGAGGGGGEGTAVRPSKKKSKTMQPNPLDQTCIHPESYDVAMRFLSTIDGKLCDFGKPSMESKVNQLLRTSSLDVVAQKLNTAVPTLQMIIDGLKQPHDYDIRAGFEQHDFKRSIVSLADLKIGTILTGRVENATLFGVFVDVGVGRSGLIPMRCITAGKLPPSKRRRSLGLGPGERVEVKVLDIDHARNRIRLDLIRVL